MRDRLLFSIAVMMTVLAVVDCGAATEPTPADIEKAVRELGAGDYRTRERASDLLWKAGLRSEEALRKALASDDPEVTSRVKAILARFDQGIFPDTPSSVIEVLEKYKAGSRTPAIDQLAKMGEAGIKALLVLRRSAPDEGTRGLITSEIAQKAVALVPALLKEGQPALPEAMQDACAESGMYDCIRDYAAWLLFHDRLKPRIAQLEANPVPSRVVLRQLAFLYRADGDLTNAIACAERLSDSYLLQNFRYEIGDWKALAEHPDGKLDDIERLGYQATCHRLAGNQAQYEAALRGIRDYAAGDLDSEAVEDCVESLLLNERPQDVLEILARRKIYMPMFKILVAQGRFEDAFGVVVKARDENDKDIISLESDHALLLNTLGETNDARRIVTRLFADQAIAGGSEFPSVQVAAAANVGMVAEAADLTAAALERLPAGNAGGRQDILRGMFPEFTTRADAWLSLLCETYPQVRPAEHLVRLHGFFASRREVLREFVALAEDAAPAVQRLTRSRQAALWQSLAAAHSLLGATNQAIASERRTCEVFGSTTNYMHLAEKLAISARWREAATAALRAVEIRPEPASLWLCGWSLVQAGDEEAGRKKMERADILALTDHEERRTMARLMNRLGAIDAANRQWELKVRLGSFEPGPLSGSFWYLAKREYRMGHFALAARMAEQERIVLHRSNLSQDFRSGHEISMSLCRSAWALAALAGGRVDEALHHARIMSEAMPEAIGLPVALIPALDKAGVKDAADALFRKSFDFHAALIRRYPRYSKGCNAIAWLSARTRHELPTGLDHARKAVELAPDCAAYRDTLAEVLFQLGRRDEAVAEIQKCVELAPSRAYYRRQLERMRENDPDTDLPVNF